MKWRKDGVAVHCILCKNSHDSVPSSDEQCHLAFLSFEKFKKLWMRLSIRSKFSGGREGKAPTRYDLLRFSTWRKDYAKATLRCQIQVSRSVIRVYPYQHQSQDSSCRIKLVLDRRMVITNQLFATHYLYRIFTKAQKSNERAYVARTSSSPTKPNYFI